jgi:hypothetical protein
MKKQFYCLVNQHIPVTTQPWQEKEEQRQKGRSIRVRGPSNSPAKLVSQNVLSNLISSHRISKHQFDIKH